MPYQNRSQEFVSKIIYLILHGIFLLDGYNGPYTNTVAPSHSIPTVKNTETYAISGLGIQFYCWPIVFTEIKEMFISY